MFRKYDQFAADKNGEEFFAPAVRLVQDFVNLVVVGGR